MANAEDFAQEEDANFTVSVEEKTPLLTATIGLKVQVIPTVEEQERAMPLGSSVDPVGISVVVPLPVPAESFRDEGLMFSINGAAILMVTGEAAVSVGCSGETI